MTKTNSRKVRIAITINLTDPNASFFGNGLRQNVVTLRDLFEKCENVSDSYIVNFSNTVFPPDYNGPWKPYLQHLISFEDALKKCDLLVLATAKPNPAQDAKIKAAGIKTVNHIMGPEFAIMTEQILFKDEKRGLYSRDRGSVSATWISPHFFERDRCLFETVNDCPSYEAPYVWSPTFIEADAQRLKDGDPAKYPGKYVPGRSAKRISVFEPNINVIKTSLVSVMAIERAYRQWPEAIETSSIFCTSGIATKQDTIDFVGGLDVYRAKKMFFNKRYPITWALQTHTDIVLSHQNQCELNYLWLDAAWLGYPVIHNSPMMQDLGWYYRDNDIATAARHIKDIVDSFDAKHEEYLHASRGYARRFMIGNHANVRGYEKLISQVMDS